jgi:hypothetical protein
MEKQIIILLVAGGFLLGFKWYEQRKKRKTINGLGDFKPGKINHTFTVPLANTAQGIDKLLQALAHRQPQVRYQTPQEIAIFVGAWGNAHFDGILNTPPEKLPVRITAQVQPNGLLIKIDEDFGTQMFMGPAKTAFFQKYEEAVKIYAHEITTTLK